MRVNCNNAIDYYISEYQDFLQVRLSSPRNIINIYAKMQYFFIHKVFGFYKYTVYMHVLSLQTALMSY